MIINQVNINRVEDHLNRLTKADLIHMVQTTNCAREFLRNVESGECRECLAVARKLGFKTRKEGE